MKSISTALLLALAISTSTAPAEAGVFRDAARTAIEVAGAVKFKSKCVIKKVLTGNGGFLCQ